MFTPYHPTAPSRLPFSPILAGLLLLMLTTAPAVLGQGEDMAEPAEAELTLVPTSLVFDPSKATSVRTLEPQDPAKLPSRGGDKMPTPGWTTIMYETAEGAWPGPWTVRDNDPVSGNDFWGDVSCRSWAGNWSVWSADIGNVDCTTYDNNMEAWMILGPFSLADAIDARAEFRIWSQTERPDIPWDSVFWGASANGTNYSGMRLGSNTTGWAFRTFDFTNVPTLGDLRGDPTVWFAFVFESDISNVMEGTYLDEIVVEKLVQGPLPDLVATDVFFRTQPSGGGIRVDNPTSSDVLYPHISYRLDNDSVNAGHKIWEIELNGNVLCSFTNTGPIAPSTRLGSCPNPVSLAPGMHTLHGEVDPDQTIQESNGGNNDAFRNYNVPSGTGCVDDLDNGVVCLSDDRFEFTMTWTDQQNVTRRVFFDKYTHRSALVFFFSGKQDIVLIVKAIPACGHNNHFWIWMGGASGGGAGWNLTVRDTVTGRTQTYFKPIGMFENAVKDDSTFPCP